MSPTCKRSETTPVLLGQFAGSGSRNLLNRIDCPEQDSASTGLECEEQAFSTAAEATEDKDGESESEESNPLEPDIIPEKVLSCDVIKPLIPLKAALFFWQAGVSSIFPFLNVLLKHKGLTISEISFILTLFPCIRFVGEITSGLIADKIGRAKPVLLGNLFLAMILLNSLHFIPNITLPDCRKLPISITCNTGEAVTPVTKKLIKCDSPGSGSCVYHCPNNVTLTSCNSFENISCFSISKTVVALPETENTEFTATSFPWQTLLNFTNITYCCERLYNKSCNSTCRENVDNCSTRSGDNSVVFELILLIIVLLCTTVSIAFRMFDATVVFLVKTHNSDFGREHCWGVLGVLTFSIFSGYAVGATTKEGAVPNYNTAIYLFDAAVLLAMLCVWKLDVQIQPRSKRMTKQFCLMLRKADFLVFAMVILFLGTCFCFSINFSFLYLDSLGAPSLLIGLIRATNALVQLPFLLTSNFWLHKIGKTNTLILGFTGYMMYFIGYFYLVNPYWALLIEITAILTNHLLWVAIVRKSQSLAPEGLTSTAIATAAALYYAAGGSVGSLLGGFIMDTYGGHTAYIVFASMAAIMGVVYASCYVVRRRCTKNN